MRLEINPQCPETVIPTDPKAADWQHLKPFGYAPGNYMNECQWCHRIVEGIDKRAISCRPCAEKAYAAARPAPEPVDQYDSGSRVLREVFSLCEDTQEKCATPDANDFNRGRAFEAKGIARAMGAWYQAEFCGQSFMGEPVTAPPADDRVKALEQRAETAEHDLQILTTVVRTGYPPPRAIPMRESAEGAARIAVERAERVKELTALVWETLNAFSNYAGQGNSTVIALRERIRAALGGE